jgi:hypothetical protein
MRDGPGGQVYLGCRFPAEPAYAAELGRHAAAIGRELADRGAMGRFSVDFVATSDSETGDRWRIYALEINLRKGGTTHPYVALRNVVPGHYEPEAGRWLAQDGSTCCYAATDNVVDPSWRGLPPAALVAALTDAGSRPPCGRPPRRRPDHRQRPDLNLERKTRPVSLEGPFGVATTPRWSGSGGRPG